MKWQISSRRRLRTVLAPSLFALFFSLVAVEPSLANSPCPPGSWFAKQDRPAAEWTKIAKWVAVAKVTGREEVLKPYTNCYEADQSKCAMEDLSVLTMQTIRLEKGSVKPERLKAGFCAPAPPKTAGGTFRFYGMGPGGYIYFEPVAATAELSPAQEALDAIEACNHWAGIPGDQSNRIGMEGAARDCPKARKSAARALKASPNDPALAHAVLGLSSWGQMELPSAKKNRLCTVVAPLAKKNLADWKTADEIVVQECPKLAKELYSQ